LGGRAPESLDSDAVERKQCRPLTAAAPRYRDEIKSYRDRWPLGTKQRTAFELFLNTGQRRSDVVRMAWSHITAEDKIVVVQQKTGRRLLIPLHRDLLATLAAADRGHVSILTTMYGKPFTVSLGLGWWVGWSCSGSVRGSRPHYRKSEEKRRYQLIISRIQAAPGWAAYFFTWVEMLQMMGVVRRHKSCASREISSL
jgi:hypothetical protein